MGRSISSSSAAAAAGISHLAFVTLTLMLAVNITSSTLRRDWSSGNVDLLDRPSIMRAYVAAAAARASHFSEENRCDDDDGCELEVVDWGSCYCCCNGGTWALSCNL
jgi:hypothetical protein